MATSLPALPRWQVLLLVWTMPGRLRHAVRKMELSQCDLAQRYGSSKRTPVGWHAVNIFARQTLRFPHSRNLRPAETAFAVREVHAGDGEDVALDDGLLAVGAKRRLHPFEAGHVADINVVQALGAGGVARFHERLNGRGRQVRELVFRVEPREVQRPVRPQLFRNPTAHAANHVEIVRVGRARRG